MSNYRTALLTTKDTSYRGHTLQTWRIRPRQYVGRVMSGITEGQHNTSYRMTRARVLAELKASIDTVCALPSVRQEMSIIAGS